MKFDIVAGIIWISGKVSEEDKIRKVILELGKDLGSELNLLWDESDDEETCLSIKYEKKFTTISEVKEMYSKIKKGK